MILYIVAIFVVALIGIKLQKTNHSNSYLDRDNTLSIIGIFTLLIFLSHVAQILNITIATANNFLDKSGALVLGVLGEQVVAPFLFFSGFGIALSFETKKNYVVRMPFLRIGKVILMFVLSMLLYFIINDTTILDFSMFGNQLIGLMDQMMTNWYIHAILICYTISLFVYIINKFICKKMFVVISHIILGVSLYTFCYYYLPFYRLCILCYFLGVFFYYTKPYFEKYMESSKKVKIVLPISILFVYIVSRVGCYLLHYEGIGYQILYQICNFGLCLSIVMLTYFVQIKNKALTYIGKNTIFIYLLLGSVVAIIKSFNSATINESSLLYIGIAFVILITISSIAYFGFNCIWKYIVKLYNLIETKIIMLISKHKEKSLSS